MSVMIYDSVCCFARVLRCYLPPGDTNTQTSKNNTNNNTIHRLEVKFFGPTPENKKRHEYKVSGEKQTVPSVSGNAKNITGASFTGVSEDAPAKGTKAHSRLEQLAKGGISKATFIEWCTDKELGDRFAIQTAELLEFHSKYHILAVELRLTHPDGGLQRLTTGTCDVFGVLRGDSQLVIGGLGVFLTPEGSVVLALPDYKGSFFGARANNWIGTYTLQANSYSYLALLMT
jgi:hypothetical protein